MNLPHNKTSFRRQGGISLIEVLVAVVILAIGALGMAGLQMRALKGGQSSVQRSQAVIMSNYMFDAIRADRQNAANYSMAMTCAVPNGGSRMANAQRDWIQGLKNALGNAATTCGQIACAPTGTDTLCTVSVRWDDTSAGGSATETLATSSRL